MSRLFAKISALFTEDDDQRIALLSVEKTIDQANLATVSTFHSGTVTLTAAVASQAFAFGGVSAATLLLIVATDEIQVQLNSNTAPLVTVKGFDAVAEGGIILSSLQRYDQSGFLLLAGKVTSLFLTNPSASTSAKCFVALVGDAV